MVTLLRKLFIRNYKNVGNAKVREKHGILAAISGIVINLLLFTFKSLIGILTFSMSIISDAINNLTDMFSGLVNLIGFKIANKPADEKHPYGHERVEYIAGMIVSFIIIAAALVLAYSSITVLIQGDTNRLDFADINWVYVILGGSILFKLLLGYIYYGLGKSIDSVTLKASFIDSLNDAICTTIVLIATIIQYFVPDLWYLDLVLSMLVAIFIFYTGIKMVKETASPLIGLSPDDKLVKKIVKRIKEFDGVLGVHDLVVHSYGPTKIFMTIHVEVDGYINIFESHDLIDRIEDDISDHCGVEITIHMDPLDTRNKEIPILKEKIEEILLTIDKELSFHDLRLVAGPTHTNVLFDVVVPEGFKMRDAILENRIEKKVNELDKKYNTIVKVDHNYLD
ncbi:MAG: cation diffusion facilitator family transporter [Erysipelotrichaceae bacterium]|jgi:cation diffusion facilitator family transporter|nr:cation diffusion facilitator family transporter [Erysipelotrichaceae bacterium]